MATKPPSLHSLRLAIGFLTVLPVRADALQPGDPSTSSGQALGRAGKWFPAVGLALGLVLVAAHWLLSQLFPPLLSAALIVALWAVLTGGLHLDGLADCCDGLFAAVSPERRLEIMRDPRLGAFGGIGLILFILLKVLAVASLPPDAAAQGVPLLLAPALGRWLILLVARQPSARPGGMGAGFALGLSRSVFIWAALIPLGLVIAGGWRAVIAAGLAHLSALAAGGLARARLGGVTGDVFGLTLELAELTTLLAFAARWPVIL